MFQATLSPSTCPSGSVAAAVCHIYALALGRFPDAAGSKYWTSKLSTGTPEAAMAHTLVTSKEGLQVLVGRLYRAELGRSPSPAALTAWATLLARGASPESLEAYLLASPEKFTADGATNHSWVTDTFRQVLHRAPNQAELALWTAALSRGSRTAVAVAILLSTDGRAATVNDLYLALLGRPPTNAQLRTSLHTAELELEIQLIAQAAP